MEYIATGDTIVQGKICSRVALATWPCTATANESCFYEENGKVYFYKAQESDFGLLYDFEAQAGDPRKIPLCEELQWPFDTLIVSVDSVVLIEVNGHIVRTQLVTQHSPLGEIIGVDSIFENIGGERGLFLPGYNGTVVSDVSSFSLQCFEEPGTAALNFKGAACIISENKESQLERNILQFWPNPVREELQIKINASQNGMVKILDFTGLIIAELKAENPDTSQNVSVADLPPGIYILQYIEQGAIVVSEKFIVIK